MPRTRGAGYDGDVEMLTVPDTETVIVCVS